MGGIYSTNGIDKNEYDDLLNKYNKIKSNYETEKIYSATLKQNIEKLESKIVNNEIKIDSMEKDNEDNVKICESIKSNYISNIVNKDNIICELEDSLKYNESIIVKNEKTIEELRNKILRLNNENKNILFLENKIKIMENSSNIQESIIDDLKQSNIKNNKINKSLEETNNELKKNNDKLNENVLSVEYELDKCSNNYIRLNKKMDSILNLIKYFRNNKNEAIKDVLYKNNTIMPDFMEKNVIENVYDYIIEKIEILVKA